MIGDNANSNSLCVYDETGNVLLVCIVPWFWDRAVRLNTKEEDILNTSNVRAGITSVRKLTRGGSSIKSAGVASLRNKGLKRLPRRTRLGALPRSYHLMRSSLILDRSSKESVRSEAQSFASARLNISDFMDKMLRVYLFSFF